MQQQKLRDSTNSRFDLERSLPFGTLSYLLEPGTPFLLYQDPPSARTRTQDRIVVQVRKMRRVNVYDVAFDLKRELFVREPGLVALSVRLVIDVSRMAFTRVRAFRESVVQNIWDPL